jgi:hypothetical protein
LIQFPVLMFENPVPWFGIVDQVLVDFTS